MERRGRAGSNWESSGSALKTWEGALGTSTGSGFPQACALDYNLVTSGKRRNLSVPPYLICKVGIDSLVRSFREDHMSDSEMVSAC